MKNKNNLIIFATYWNEKYWIRASLAQIEKINPVEVIICDGCFDPKVPNYSTDGTRGIIKKFVSRHPNARMISALRPGFFHSAWLLLRGHRHLPWWTIFRPVRWKFLFKSLTLSSYRRNQAITFNYMISISSEWKPGIWFMTYDADQFYGDKMIEKIKEIVNDEESSFDLATGKEITFFGNFKQCTDSYEKRTYNNMPHRIYSDTLIQPTRGIIRETKSKKGFLLKNLWSKHLYIFFAKTTDAGIYFHYKFNDPKRFDAGYQLGDRKKPDPRRCTTKKFSGSHPEIIQKYFKL